MEGCFQCLSVMPDPFKTEEWVHEIRKHKGKDTLLCYINSIIMA